MNTHFDMNRLKTIALLLSFFALAVLFPSCSMQEADITVHYSISNESGFDLALKTSKGLSFGLPAGATFNFTDISEGIDYHGSCSFKTVFEDGGILTISYKEKEYDFDMMSGVFYSGSYIGLKDARFYDVHKDAPREYSLEYTLNSDEIINALRYLRVWENNTTGYGEDW